MPKRRLLTKVSYYIVFYLAVFALTPVSAQFISPKSLWADDIIPAPHIYDLTVAHSKRYLLAYFSLKNGYTNEVTAALKSGIPIRYTYEIELSEPRLIMDKTLFHGYISRTLSYDALRGEYIVVLGPENPRAISVKTRDEVWPMMFEINSFPVAQAAALQHGVAYRLRVRAAAEKAESHIPFPGLMDVFSPWGFKTNWHEIYFTY